MSSNIVESIHDGFSIVIPTWKNLAYLTACIHSIKRNSTLDHQILVYVNEVNTKYITYLQSQDITFMTSEKNGGVTVINYLRSLVGKSVICYINDDMYVLPEWDTNLIRFCESNSVPKNAWISSTMIEPVGGCNKCCVVRDYGRSVSTFQEQKLLQEYKALYRSHVTGTTWPPNLMHVDTWDAVGGLSTEYGIGVGTDPDLAKKLWDNGTRDFIGVGNSLVYHFMCKTTSRMRPNNSKEIFQKKHGMTMESFIKQTLKRGSRWQG